MRSFVYHAADRAVRDVFVGGVQVIADRKVLTLDQAAAAQRLAAAQERMEAAAPQHDYLRRRAEEIAPLSLKLAD
jgi:5-methylthioadenosine/S-adenosylhomocysteine deaminase